MTEKDWEWTAQRMLGLSTANKLVGKRVKVTYKDYTLKRSFFRWSIVRKLIAHRKIRTRSISKENTHEVVGILTALRPDFGLAFHTASHLEEWMGVIVDGKYVHHYDETTRIEEIKEKPDAE